MEQRKEVRVRVLLFPLPLQGHITPMLELAHVLHSHGFSITLIHTLFNSPDPSLHPHFTFCSFPDGLSHSHSSPTSNLLQFLTLINTVCVAPFRECLGKLLCDSSEEAVTVSCLITDAWCYSTQAVATSFGLPRLVLRTGGISSFLAFASFPLLTQLRYYPIQESQMEEAVAELPPLRVRDLPVVSTNEPDLFFDLVCSFVNHTMASLGVIFNSFEALESSALAKLTQQFSTPIFPIGPFHKYFPHHSVSSASIPSLSKDQGCISWLDQRPPNSVLYVSFGSIAAVSGAEFLEIAWGLANSEHPFLWVVRPGMVRGWDWLEPLPSGFLENLGGRGHIVKWAPQQQVLAHPSVGAFWSHNGWNSTVESICEGVPMICMPCFTDQLVNARYASHVWKVGLPLEKELERGEIERTVRKLMEGKEGREIRERASHLKQQAQLCLQHGGSSYHSLQGLVNHVMSLKYSPSQYFGSPTPQL